MSKLAQINFNPDRNTLRKFGFVALVGFGALSVMAWTESFLFTFGLGNIRSTVASVLALLGLYCLVCGLLYPAANKPIFIGLSVITFPIGLVLSYLIMGLLFFGLIGFVALIMRVVKYDPMNRQIEEDAQTYWSDARAVRPQSDYFKQY